MSPDARRGGQGVDDGSEADDRGFDHALCQLAEVRQEERTDLFIRKLQQCSYIFDFNDTSADLTEKHTKGQTLHEMLDYITVGRGVITEAIYPEVVAMASPGSRRLRPVKR